jgi:hypothetical protein
MVMDLPPELLLLLPLSIAAGLDLYLSLLAAGVGLALLGGENIVSVPSEVSLPITLALAGLYVVELAAELRPLSAMVWHNLQLLLRPLGAALLGLLLLRGEPGLYVILGVVTAGSVAAFSHVLFWGLQLVARLMGRRALSLLALSLLADLGALGLIGLAVLRPEAGLVVTGLLLTSGLVFGRHLHGATRLGMALLADRIWGIVSPADWRPEGDLPQWVCDLSTENVRESVRGARAGATGGPAVGQFRAGWIIQGNHYLLFVHKVGWRARSERLEGECLGEEIGPLAKTVRFRSPEGTRRALFLQVGLNAPEPHKW